MLREIAPQPVHSHVRKLKVVRQLRTAPHFRFPGAFMIQGASISMHHSEFDRVCITRRYLSDATQTATAVATYAQNSCAVSLNPKILSRLSVVFGHGKKGTDLPSLSGDVGHRQRGSSMRANGRRRTEDDSAHSPGGYT